VTDFVPAARPLAPDDVALPDAAVRSPGARQPDAGRTYVLDTSVLLADPWAIQRFAEHEVVIPLVVITELEAKRHHPELGWAARRILRRL
jgi:PhoH-like ATPase